MPRNGTKPEPTLTPEFILTTKLIGEFRDKWNEQQKESGVSSVLYSRLSIVALTQLAAIVGVDVGMTTEQFIAVAKANFDEAFKVAPRFG